MGRSSRSKRCHQNLRNSSQLYRVYGAGLLLRLRDRKTDRSYKRCLLKSIYVRIGQNKKYTRLCSTTPRVIKQKKLEYNQETFLQSKV